jgi:hypothetical protein
MSDNAHSTSNPLKELALDLKESSFNRLPRPQKVLDPNQTLVPTKLSLLKVKNATFIRPPLPPPPISIPPPPPLPSSYQTSNSRASKDVNVYQEDTLGPMITLGRFVQSGTNWAVRAQRGRHGLVMVKKLKESVGRKEQKILEGISHKNITKIIHVSWDGEFLCLAFEYCRFTLAEVLHVHLELEEYHLKHIARSVSIHIYSSTWVN